MTSPGYLEERPHGVDFGEWWLPLGQLYGRDSQGPDVAADVVRVVQLSLAGHHLRITVGKTTLVDIDHPSQWRFVYRLNSWVMNL